MVKSARRNIKNLGGDKLANVVTITGVKKLYKMGSEIAAALNGADLKIDAGECSLTKN